VCGGSASGKTTVARKIIEELNVQWVSLVCMDSFYKVSLLHTHTTHWITYYISAGSD